MVVCPSCGSSRIRNDYKPAPIFLRVAGIRALLCDHCNHQFRAFSPRSPKHHIPSHATRKADVFNHAPAVDLNRLSNVAAEEPPIQNREDPRRRIVLRNLKTGPQQTVNGELVDTDPPDLRTRITTLYEQRIRQQEALKEADSESYST